MMEVFENNDTVYLLWMQQNPMAYVVNTERRNTTNYFVLHVSGCPHIATTNGVVNGGYTEREYIKVGASTVGEIESWLKQEKPNFKSISKECKTCNPSSSKIAVSSKMQTTNSSSITVNFENILIGGKYNRDLLASLWGYGGREAISRGIITPANTNLIILFVTKDKPASYTQYVDYISSDYLYWEGEKKGANNRRIIESSQNGNAIHLFFRDEHRSDFTYKGVIELENYTEHADAPMEAVFRIIGSDEEEDNTLPKLNFKASGGPTMRQALRSSRVGQGVYRQNLVSLWKTCAVTALNLPEVLTASHIKPWKDSDNMERLDPYNGLLLAPNLDTLFDKGYISFLDNGSVLLSKRLSAKAYSSLGITSDLKLRKVFDENIPYLEYHRKKVFVDKLK